MITTNHADSTYSALDRQRAISELDGLTLHQLRDLVRRVLDEDSPRHALGLLIGGIGACAESNKRQVRSHGR